MSCGECTACCTLFPVKWLNKGINTPCIHCDKGCLIQDTKPDECRDFNCAYIQSGATNEKLRPDNCGIVFEKVSDRIFYGTVIPEAKITDYAKGQVNAFVKQGFSVVLASLNETSNKFFINIDHDEYEIRNEFAEILNGNLQH